MRKTFRRFVEAVATGRLVEPFLIVHARIETGIPWAGNFLAKHRVGNPSGQTELFERLETTRVRYSINRRKLISAASRDQDKIQ
jgi:hypothetical protein